MALACAGGGGGKIEKIKGTEIKTEKGGRKVRVVTADGKEFPVEATKAVYKYLRSIGQEVEPKSSGGKKVMKKQKQKTPEEKEAYKEKAKEKHQENIAKEGRVLVGSPYISGEIVQRGGNFVWVKPDDADAIPATVRGKLQAMNDEFRTKAASAEKGKKEFLGGMTENVVYVNLHDVEDESMAFKAGTKCQFKLYTDNKGVGGCEVTSGSSSVSMGALGSAGGSCTIGTLQSGQRRV